MSKVPIVTFLFYYINKAQPVSTDWRFSLKVLPFFRIVFPPRFYCKHSHNSINRDGVFVHLEPSSFGKVFILAKLPGDGLIKQLTLCLVNLTLSTYKYIVMLGDKGIKWMTSRELAFLDEGLDAQLGDLSGKCSSK